MINSDISLVKFHEGCILTAKPDAKGMWSIGWGHDIGAPEEGALAPTCTQDQADNWLDGDIALARARAAVAVGDETWLLLDEVRKAALVDMAYELGGHGLAEFSGMLQAVREARWGDASDHGLASLWAKEVPVRAHMDMGLLLTGQWPPV